MIPDYQTTRFDNLASLWLKYVISYFCVESTVNDIITLFETVLIMSSTIYKWLPRWMQTLTKPFADWKINEKIDENITVYLKLPFFTESNLNLILTTTSYFPWKKNTFFYFHDLEEQNLNFDIEFMVISTEHFCNNDIFHIFSPQDY